MQEWEDEKARNARADRRREKERKYAVTTIEWTNNEKPVAGRDSSDDDVCSEIRWLLPLVWSDNPSWTSLLSEHVALSQMCFLCHDLTRSVTRGGGTIPIESRPKSPNYHALRQCIITRRQTVPRVRRLWSRRPHQSSKKRSTCIHICIYIYIHVSRERRLFLYFLWCIHSGLYSTYLPFLLTLCLATNLVQLIVS